MADLSDVENVLRDTVVGIVYPNGTGQPSIVNRDIRVGRGNPLSKSLDADLANGIINISVNAMQGMYRTVPQYMRKWRPVEVTTFSLTATVEDDTITIGGTITLPQSVMVIANDIGYPYVVVEGDTLDTIAAGIAELVPNATADGNVVTVAGAYRLIARIGGLGNVVKEVKRQEQVFQIKVFTSTDNNGYLVRDQLSSTLDAQLAYLIWLQLPDGFKGNIHCKTGFDDDTSQKEKLLTRTLHYAVEYPTTISSQQYYVITETKQNLTVTAT